MCRVNIEISVVDYGELMKWARIWHKKLALAIEETKEEYSDKKKNKIITLNEDKIPKMMAEEFLGSLMDSETYAYDSNELKNLSHLVEIWRPIAEGSLL